MLTSVAIFLTIGLAFVSAKSVPKEKRRSPVCYGDLGCFGTGGVWVSRYRPINLNPQSPGKINARFMLHTRQNPAKGDTVFLKANNLDSIRTPHLKASRPTKIICHGFIDNGLVGWMAHMKDELLKQGDYNVVLVDWGGGSGLPYTQATANTRVVGAEIAKLIETMGDVANVRPEDVHIIGHSLGAHVAGYAGERTLNLGRITGLDPADPYFQYMDRVVRLDPTDAAFVDVIHTDDSSIFKLGLGMKQACGHVDYFPNSGHDQPGCDKGAIEQLRLEGSLYNGAKEFAACNHLRSYKYFTESINSPCPFEGFKCQSYSEFERGRCLTCDGGACGYMGFHADRTKPPAGTTYVQYFLDTGAAAPFCRYHYQIKVAFSQLPGSREESGSLFMNLIGSNGQLGETKLSKHVIDVQPGHTYPFLVTSPHDIGDLTEISFRWNLDSHWYSLSFLHHHSIRINSVDIINGETQRNLIDVQPGHTYTFLVTSPHDIGDLTEIAFRWNLDSHWYSFLHHHSIRINSVDIVNGETQRKHRFCGFNAEIDHDVTRTITQRC